MFRFNSSIDGIVIDYDSFQYIQTGVLQELCSIKHVLFITSSESERDKLETEYGKNSVLLIPGYIKTFAPNQLAHKLILDAMNLCTTQIVYVTADAFFVQNALSFMSGIVFVSEVQIQYGDLSHCPDLICPNIQTLVEWLKNGVSGFLGEIIINPIENGSGTVIQANFTVDKIGYPIICLGRYFGYTQYMSQLHPYSSAIYLNKREGTKSFGRYNYVFSELLIKVIERIVETEKIDYITAVPTRPGKINRNTEIIKTVSEAFNIGSLLDLFICNCNYDSQKTLSVEGRRRNVQGVFEITCPIKGKNVLLYDDIVTTGATISECVRVLKTAGAHRIYIVVLAVNQQDNYWTIDEPKVYCQQCGAQMRLLFNSLNYRFFYSCKNDFSHNKVNFEVARCILQDKIDDEFKK